MKYNYITPKLFQNYPKLEKLNALKALTVLDKKTLNIPSQLDLLLLSANLNYHGRLIMYREVQETGDLTVEKCIDQSKKIMVIVEDYENKFITYEELQKIKKDFHLNYLYA